MKRGVILEKGTHEELIARRGDYYGLVKTQNVKQDIKDKTSANDTDDADSIEDILEGANVSSNKMIYSIWDDDKEASQLLLSRTKTAKSISSVIASNIEEYEEMKY